MEKITTLKVYNLLDSKGNKLQLKLGHIDNFSPTYHGERGYRWSFIGTRIPMPIRNGTWFNGFPEHTMIEWLNGNDWYVQTCVDMCSGKADVFDLPNGNDDLNVKIVPERCEADERAFCELIRELIHNHRRVSACHLYRYANGGDLHDADKAIREICNET